MQTLGLSDSTPRTESRIKSLFWPSIESGADVDYLGAQGYWICAAIAALNFIVFATHHHPITAVLLLVFYYLAGVGVRERSRYAAFMVFTFYAANVLASLTEAFPGVLTIIMGALLLSNIRATWIASEWDPSSEGAGLPPRLGSTWGDKVADQVPMWLWPKTRVFFFIFAPLMLIFAALGIALMIMHRLR